MNSISRTHNQVLLLLLLSLFNPNSRLFHFASRFHFERFSCSFTNQHFWLLSLCPTAGGRSLWLRARLELFIKCINLNLLQIDAISKYLFDRIQIKYSLCADFSCTFWWCRWFFRTTRLFFFSSSGPRLAHALYLFLPPLYVLFSDAHKASKSHHQNTFTFSTNASSNLDLFSLNITLVNCFLCLTNYS